MLGVARLEGSAEARSCRETALAAGHAVVATGRNTERVSAAVGAHDDLLVVTLDVTDPASAQAAVEAATANA